MKIKENSVESFNGNKIDSRSQLIKKQDKEHQSLLQVDEKKDEIIIIRFIEDKFEELLLWQEDPCFNFGNYQNSQ